VRDLYVGFGGKGLSMAGYYAPQLTDRLMGMTMFDLQQGEEPSSSAPDGLFEPSGALQERGNYEGHVAESSV